MEDTKITHIYGCSPEPLKIKLEKNSKGYNWEVSVAGDDISAILCQIRQADQQLKSEYGGA